MQELREREVKNFIGGEWEEANGRETEPVYDPATGEDYSRDSAFDRREDVDRAVQKARSGRFPRVVCHAR